MINFNHFFGNNSLNIPSAMNSFGSNTYDRNVNMTMTLCSCTAISKAPQIFIFDPFRVLIRTYKDSLSNSQLEELIEEECQARKDDFQVLLPLTITA